MKKNTLQSLSLMLMSLTLVVACNNNKGSSTTASAPVSPYTQCNRATMDANTYNICLQNAGGYNNNPYGNYNTNAYPNNWYSYSMTINNRPLYKQFVNYITNCNGTITSVLGQIFGASQLTCDNLTTKAGVIVTTSNLTPSTQGYIGIVIISNNAGSNLLQVYPQGFSKIYQKIPGFFRLNGNSIQFTGSNGITAIINNTTTLTANAPINVSVLVNNQPFLSGALTYSYNTVPYSSNNFLPTGI